MLPLAMYCKRLCMANLAPSVGRLSDKSKGGWLLEGAFDDSAWISLARCHGHSFVIGKALLGYDKLF